MIVKKYVFVALFLALSWAPGASGFRTCETQDSYAWSASSEDGTAMVSSAASGEMLASGSWDAGRAVYKTAEECKIV